MGQFQWHAWRGCRRPVGTIHDRCQSVLYGREAIQYGNDRFTQMWSAVDIQCHVFRKLLDNRLKPFG